MKARKSEIDQAGGKSWYVRFGGNDEGGSRFGKPEKFAEEAPAGEQFMAENVLCGGGFGMRAEIEIRIGESRPGGVELVDFGGVGIEEVLPPRLGGLGDLGAGDRDGIVVHRHSAAIWITVFHRNSTSFISDEMEMFSSSP